MLALMVLVFVVCVPCALSDAILSCKAFSCARRVWMRVEMSEDEEGTGGVDAGEVAPLCVASAALVLGPTAPYPVEFSSPVETTFCCRWSCWTAARVSGPK